MILLGLIVFVLLLSSSNHIASFLNIKSTIPVVIVAVVLIFSVLVPVNTGILQGLQKFEWLGFINVLYAATKLISGIILVRIGLGVNGALGALIVASSCTTSLCDVVVFNRIR